MDYWQKQTDEPLYPDLLWSKPVTKRGAGKLLIIGGNANGFSLVAKAYSEAEKVGAGHIRAVVPDSLVKLTKGLPFIEYAPSNPSGGFAKSALGTLLELAEWADGVLLAGDLGKNSETSLLLESFMDKYSGVLVIDNTAQPSLNLRLKDLLNSSNRVAIWSKSDLQKAVVELKLPKAITSETGKAQIAETLRDMSCQHPSNLVMIDEQTIWTASQGQVTSTAIQGLSLSASAPFGVWALQNPEKTYEALVCASWEAKSA